MAFLPQVHTSGSFGRGKPLNKGYGIKDKGGEQEMWIHPAVKKRGEYWESWFAWYPVLTELAEGQGAYAWLHEVERREYYGYGGWQWRYREKLS